MDDPAPAASVTIELTLAPDDLKSLLARPELRLSSRKRDRAAALRIVWHDTVDGGLAEDGLCLAHRHTPEQVSWDLEWMSPPPDGIAPPGLLTQAIAHDHEPPDPLSHSLVTGPLLPIASFEGSLRPLTAHDDGVQVVLIQGELRAIAALTPIWRLRLSGDGAFSTARRWAETIRLEAPSVTLAAEAFVLAGRTVGGARLGAPSLRDHQSVSDGFAFIVAHLACVITHHAVLVRRAPPPEPVHQMRVALRRLRSALSLFRRAVACPELEMLKDQLKQLGTVLGPPRDWDVFTAGMGQELNALFPGDPAITRLLTASERRRQAGYQGLIDYLDSPAWRGLTIAMTELATTRPWLTPMEPDASPDAQRDRRVEWQQADIKDFARHALKRRLDAVLAPGADLSDLPVEALHDIRLHGKRLRYAAEFFAPLYPGKATGRFIRRMSALQEKLGHLNDAAVAAHLMSELRRRPSEHQHAIGIVRGFTAARTAGNREKIEQSWKRFRKQESFWV